MILVSEIFQKQHFCRIIQQKSRPIMLNKLEKLQSYEQINSIKLYKLNPIPLDYPAKLQFQKDYSAELDQFNFAE